MSDLKIVTLPSRNLRDVPQLLRNLADQIEAGDFGQVTKGAGVILSEAGGPIVCGWGDVTDIESIGLLHLGTSWLASHRVER